MVAFRFYFQFLQKINMSVSISFKQLFFIFFAIFLYCALQYFIPSKGFITTKAFAHFTIPCVDSSGIFNNNNNNWINLRR